MSDSIDGVESSNEPLIFFSNAAMLSHLTRAHHSISRHIEIIRTQSGADDTFNALCFVREALNEMMLMPAIFDLSCDYNIKHVGAKFTESVQEVSAAESYEIDSLFSLCYRFVVEFELKSSTSMSSGLRSAWIELADMDLNDLKSASFQIRWAKNHMAIQMLREYINHPHMTSLKDLPKAIQASEDARIKSIDELSQREERVNALADKLKGYENAYNFVGLYQGFSNLRKDKASEKDLTFKFMVVLGICLVIVPLLKVLNVIEHSSDLVKESFAIAALLAFELMVVYFFRITLQNFRSTKAQLLQIDLRMTLCQFINSYVEFASDARKSDKELLTRFEQVIFSGIVTDESVIPSTFDGLEQVAKIVESLKPK
ncbi:hypothetical protein BLL42_02170 [Pseudomonas frederiksbergensis]|uniref:Uncharacterized protein n=1 Tax=Pseudomonas frederiksbergensis TaxID=104087 RepID=A0A1J0EFL6_9PSED|nr:hypothetical protein BLL42_02170 [Pseudomonas frederiksbergensis]